MGDPTSYANFEEISTKELSLNLSVDFNRKILAGVVTYAIEAHAADVSTLVSTLVEEITGTFDSFRYLILVD